MTNLPEATSGMKRQSGSLKRFLNAEACRLWLLDRLHPNGAACPECGAAISHPKQEARFWALESARCLECGRTFNGLSGTVFHRLQLSPVGIVALLLLLHFERGTAEIAEQLGVDERTARRWRKRFEHTAADISPMAITPTLEPDNGNEK